MHLRPSLPLLAALAVTGVGSTAPAAIVGVTDYTGSEDFESGSTPSGATEDLLLEGNATQSDGTALGSGYADEVKTGFVTAPGPDVDGTPANNSNGNGEWRKYFGGETFGDATLTSVFRPNYNGSPNGHRATLVNHNGGGNDDSVFLYAVNGNARIRLGDKGKNRVQLDTPVDWNDQTWYFLATTFREGADANDGNEDTRVALYVRELKQADGSDDQAGLTKQYLTTDEDLLDPTDQFNFNKQLGINIRTGGTDSAQGDVAFTQLQNTYSTEAELDSLYNSLIPEPASLALLGLGGMTLLGRRREQRG